MAQVIEQTKLFYTEGTSDKVYETWIEKVPGEELFKVNYQNGRRGSTLRPGTKTATPVALDSARKIYEKLVKSKMAEGYTPCESGQVYAGGEKAGQVSGLQPMLLNPVDESEADVLCSNDAWVMQEKYDGERQMARLTLKDQSFSMSNRKGLICTHTQALQDQVAALAKLLGVNAGEVVLDGERIGDQFVIFDVLALGESLVESTLKERLEALEKLKTALQDNMDITALTAAPTSHGNNKKTRLMQLRKAGVEGVVFKRLDSVYSAGRPASGGDWVKFKFVETASCVVIAPNEGKRSVSLKLLDERGTWAEVGNVTIPANHVIPSSGDIVEVQYLYAYPNGSLFQPVYLGKRTDIDEKDCRTSQLKYKEGLAA